MIYYKYYGFAGRDGEKRRIYMDDHQSTAAFLREQCIRWPGLMPQDLLKALHQSVFGCGHLLADHAGGLSRLREEMRYAAVSRGPWAELLDGDFCRVSLGYLRQRGMAPETVMELFALSAEVPERQRRGDGGKTGGPAGHRGRAVLLSGGNGAGCGGVPARRLPCLPPL